ncbi:hypothetical protein F441_21573, partial [Phytophthora nicotianae CJ01A1]
IQCGKRNCARESTEAMKPKSRQQHQIENKSTTYETHYTQALENFFAIQWGKPKLAALDPLKHLAKSQTAIQYNFSSDPASLTSPMRSYLERTAELLNTTGTNLPASEQAELRQESLERFVDLVVERLGLHASDPGRDLGVLGEVVAHELEHTGGISTVHFEVERDVDVAAFGEWLSEVVTRYVKGADVLRVKGVLSVAGDAEDRRCVVQGVLDTYTIAPGLPWEAGEQRVSRLVLIGQGLDRDELERGFQNCLVDNSAGSETKKER